MQVCSSAPTSNKGGDVGVAGFDGGGEDGHLIRFGSTGRDVRSPYLLPPPPQTPYPSQERPVEMHREQAGQVSSHLTFRVLFKSEYGGFAVEACVDTYLQVRQPDLTLTISEQILEVLCCVFRDVVEQV